MKRFLAVFPYIVMGVAFVLLWRELHGIDWRSFFNELRGYPPSRLLWALLALAVNYLVMSGYDAVALRQLGERLPRRLVLRTAAEAFSISNLVGHSMLTGLAVRVREYARRGMRLSKITQLMVITVEAWWLGFFFLCGMVLVNLPNAELRAYSHFLSVGAGIGLLALVAVYLMACWRLSGRTVHFGRWEIFLPSLETGMMKMLVGAADTLMVSLTLYLLLPSGFDIPFTTFVSLHLTAHFIGVVSMAPGGLGVLEGVLLKLLEPYGSPAAILASILLFRVIHYLLPAGLTLAAQLLRVRK